MNSILYLFVGWLLMSATIAFIGRDRKIGWFRSFVACVFLTPLIGVLIVLMSPPREEPYQ
jgi:hypothetical protein